MLLNAVREPVPIATCTLKRIEQATQEVKHCDSGNTCCYEKVPRIE